jgi:diguanylate cyclase (GGDEF)-like protein
MNVGLALEFGKHWTNLVGEAKLLERLPGYQIMTEDELELAILEKYAAQHRKAETTTPPPADKCAWELDMRQVLGELTGEQEPDLSYTASLWLNRLAPPYQGVSNSPLRRCSNSTRDTGDHQFHARAFQDPINNANAPAWDRMRHLREKISSQPSFTPRDQLDQKFRILFSPAAEQRHFDEWRAAALSDEFSIGALFVDIDHFKALNTKHTETVVDQSFLPEIQSIFKTLSAHHGAAYKHGGDEYVVLLPNHSAEETAAFAEKIRLTFETREFRIGSSSERITVSIGAAVWPFHGQSLTEVLSAANSAEHTSKAQGRNRVTLAPGINLKAPDQIAIGTASTQPESISRADVIGIETPSAEISTTSYIVQLYEAGALRDLGRLKKLYDEIKLEPGRTIGDERLESLYLKLRLDAGDQFALTQLEDLANQHADWIDPLSELAEYSKSIGEHKRALIYSGQATKRARSEQERVFTVRQHAAILAADDQGEIGADIVNKLIGSIEDRALRAALFDTLADIHELRGDRRRGLLALERGLREEPENQRRRFRAALTYSSSNGDQLLALHHYHTLLKQDRRYSYALNNLAHTYGELGLTGAKISALEEAERFQAPLPTRNLASALAEAGFFEEAKKRLGELEDRFKFEKGVVAVLRDIQYREGSESTRLTNLSAGARRVHKKLAEALDRNNSSNSANEKFAGAWRAGNVSISITIGEASSGNEISGTFVFEERVFSPGIFGVTVEKKPYSISGWVIDGVAIVDVTPNAAEGKGARRGSTVLTGYTPPEKRLWAYLRDNDSLLVVVQDKNYGVTETVFSRVAHEGQIASS